LIEPQVKSYYLDGRDFDLSADVIDPQYLHLFVHCHPDHGTAHMVVHACLKNLWTTNGEILAHKNLPLDDVLTVLSQEAEEGWLGVSEFRSLREEFRQNEVYTHVKSYESGLCDGEGLHEAIGAVAAATTPFASMVSEQRGIKVPIFTHYAESKTAPQPDGVLFEDEEMLIIENHRSVSSIKHGNHAAMSYIHFLAIPKVHSLPYTTHTVPTLYSYCTHTVPTLYSHCTHSVLTLYSIPCTFPSSRSRRSGYTTRCHSRTSTSGCYNGSCFE
jgi:hypothetical protein